MAKKRPRSSSVVDGKAELESSCSPDNEDIKNKKKTNNKVLGSDNRPVSEVTVKQKTGTKRKLSETNDEQSGDSALHSSENDAVVSLSEPGDGTKKKMRKPRISSTEDRVNGTKKLQSSNTSPVKRDANTSKKAKKMKKKKKKKQGKTCSESDPTTDGKVSPGSSSGVAQSSALDYIRKWKHDRDGWTFQKVRQVWLLQHIYDTEKIGTDDFEILVEYLENLKGRARQETINEAEKLMNEAEEDADSKLDATSATGKKVLTDAQFERIRQVLQMLS